MDNNNVRLYEALGKKDDVINEFDWNRHRKAAIALAECYFTCDKSVQYCGEYAILFEVRGDNKIAISPENVSIGMKIVLQESRGEVCDVEVLNKVYNDGKWILEGENHIISNVNFRHDLTLARKERNYKTQSEIEIEHIKHELVDMCIGNGKQLFNIHCGLEGYGNLKHAFDNPIATVGDKLLVEIHGRKIKMEDITTAKSYIHNNMDPYDMYNPYEKYIHGYLPVTEWWSSKSGKDWIIETQDAIYTTIDCQEIWSKALYKERDEAERATLMTLSTGTAKEFNKWFHPNTIALMCHIGLEKDNTTGQSFIEDRAIVVGVSRAVAQSMYENGFTNAEQLSWKDFDKIKSAAHDAIDRIRNERVNELNQLLVSVCVKSEKPVVLSNNKMYGRDDDGVSKDISSLRRGDKVSTMNGFIKNITDQENDFVQVELGKMKVLKSWHSDDGRWLVETDKMILTNMENITDAYVNEMQKNGKMLEKDECVISNDEIGFNR